MAGADWVHVAPPFATAFLASAVEFIEALTVILAAGSVRGWRAVLSGAASALAVLVLLVAIFGTSLAHAPLRAVRLVMDAVLLLFGLRWLQKAVLRAAGILPLRDEDAAFARACLAMRPTAVRTGWDGVAFATGFQVTMVEGAEVVVVVLGIGAGADRLLLAAGAGAAVAFALIAALGIVLHRPLARVPENGLKFAVGVILSAFGCFWFGEAIGLRWPGDDWSIPGLVAGFAAAGFVAVAACRRRVRVAA